VMERLMGESSKQRIFSQKLKCQPPQSKLHLHTVERLLWLGFLIREQRKERNTMRQLFSQALQPRVPTNHLQATLGKLLRVDNLI
jgi:hypothetical protein